jgi:aldehyde:ferredoxin oxidoreductase
MILNGGGILPTKNFVKGVFDKAEDISGQRMRDTILVGRGSCYACSIRCKREVEVTEPYHVDPAYGGPEFETIGSIGSICNIADLKAIALANQICGAYTVDTITAGTTIAFAMECFEKGLLTIEDTGGIELEFGNAEAMLEVLELICKREGIGALLAEGLKAAAEKIGNGAERFAIHIKGQAPGAHDPRGKVALGLGYALSPTGGDHLEAVHDPVFAVEGGIKFVRSLGINEPLPALELSPRKVRAFIYLQHLYNVFNSIGVCNFVAHPWGPLSVNDLVDYVNAVTGWDTSLWELMKVGERHSNMARLFNNREGLTTDDDTLPDRFFEPLEDGPLAGEKLDREEFQQALAAYYRAMGWGEDGVPLLGKLEELELTWALPASSDAR